MPDPKLAQFDGQKYISMETFKKNGQGVKTPVWFVLHKRVLRVYESRFVEGQAHSK